MLELAGSVACPQAYLTRLGITLRSSTGMVPLVKIAVIAWSWRWPVKLFHVQGVYAHVRKIH